MRKTTLAPSPPVLADTLGVLLPTPTQTLLLRASLVRGPAGREAWDDYCRRVGRPRDAVASAAHGLGRHLAFVSAGLAANEAAVPADLAAHLRAVRFREELRSATFRRLGQEALASLAAAGLPITLAKGAALGDLVYPEPSLRHSHDLDLLVEDDEIAAAAGALAAQGFEPAVRAGGDRPGGARGGDRGETTFLHATGLPVVLHTRPLASPFYALPSVPTLRARGVRAEVMGAAVHVLAPADSLVLVLSHAASTASRGSASWVLDAWHLVECSPKLDWESAVATTLEGGLALPLFVLLDYVRGPLQAKVPPAVLERLRQAAATAGPRRRDAALHGARAFLPGGAGDLLRSSRTIGSLAAVLQHLAFPTPEYLRARAGPVRKGALPLGLAYARSWARLARRVARLVLGRIRRVRGHGAGRASP